MANDKRMYSSEITQGPPAKVMRSLSTKDETGLIGKVQRPIETSRKQSMFYVKSAFESLDYRPLSNQLELEMQKSHTYHHLKIQGVLRIGVFLLTGMFTALFGVFLELLSDKLGYIKFHSFELYALKEFDGTFKEFQVFVVYRLVGVIVPVMVGAALVVFIAPYAAGGGVAQCIGYLNGIKVPNILSLKGLVVKVLSTACTVVSGLAGGKEGPMMHIGTMTGGILPSALPYLEFKLEPERRDFAAAGFGAGLAVVFGAPIGGLLLALEEGVSFLELSVMWKIYLCCVTGYAVGTIVMSLIHHGTVELGNTEILSLGYISPEVTQYGFFELIPFAVMAVFGGLVGALLIKIHTYVAAFRDNHIKSKTRKMMAAFVAACIVVFFQVSAIWLMRACSVYPDALRSVDAKKENDTCDYCLHRMYCPKGERSDMSLLFSLTQGDVLRLFFSSDVLQMSSLGLYAVLYFILMCITMGLSISAGIFIPQIILGAAWGRLFGTLLNKLFNGASWARPAKYAYLGAAAQLSGTVGKTFSILVIFVEASQNVHIAFPLMVIVSITRLVCTFFIMPIYETQMHLMGLPFLPHQAPPLDCDVPTTAVMSVPPLVTLPPEPTVGTIVYSLRDNTHNGFPVVEMKDSEPLLVGLILRQQLLLLLKYRAFAYPPPTTNKQMCECYLTYIKESRTHLDEEKIIESVEAEYYTVTVDLTPYYNCFPQTATVDMPLIKTYELFRNLGVRHLVVITKNHEAVGMITRKDLAKFHTVESFCRVKIKEMLIK